MDAKLERLIARVESDLAELRAYAESLNGQKAATKPWFYRPGRLLWEIRERGGEVTTEQFYAMGDALGYDRRGLGGFFSGNNPTLEMVVGGSNSGNRRLTRLGELEAERWLQLFGEAEA